MLKRLLLLGSIVVVASCGSRKNPQAEVSPGPNGAAAVPNYAPRIGVGVATQARTCFAVANPNLTPGTPVTLVSPTTPQSFVQGQISGPARGPCPVFREGQTGFSSYDVDAAKQSIQKLTPLIALAGPIGPMMANGGTVSVDLDQNGKLQYFRACSAGDVIYLTVWAGTPLTGTLLWRGSYYAPDNPGVAPACGANESTTM